MTVIGDDFGHMIRSLIEERNGKLADTGNKMIDMTGPIAKVWHESTALTTVSFELSLPTFCFFIHTIVGLHSKKAPLPTC